MKRKYESEAMQVIHEEMMDFHRSGYISDEEMREFDELCFGEEDETTPAAENTQKEEPVQKVKYTSG